MEENNKKELTTLIAYLIKHNESHNKELEELASSLKDINYEAYLKVIDALKSYKEGNSFLKEALDLFNK